MRRFNATRRVLVQIQAERKARDLEEASAVRESPPPDWQSSQDGFACSSPKSIATYSEKITKSAAAKAKREPAP